MLVAARLGRRLGVVDAVAVSALEGVGPLRPLLAPGSTAALLGPSGAGKSTLVNARSAKSARRPGRSAPPMAGDATPR